MILINKLSINTVVLTLAEKTKLDPVYYLFEFIKDGSPGTKKIFLSADLSTNKYRYNQFLIEDSITENALIGKMNFDTGQWKYNVYEQLSATNLVVPVTGLVENGRVEVVKPDDIIKEFNSQQTVIKQFNG